jgi:cytochrome c peroxidase
MQKIRKITGIAIGFFSLILTVPAYSGEYVLSAKKDDLRWLLPKTAPAPANNLPTPARIALGKALFFDPRLSSDGNMSCASCHSPMLGWSDGLPLSKGSKSRVLPRSSPTIINSVYNKLQMWDGRKKTLEEQAIGPLESPDEMATDFNTLFTWLNADPTYRSMFGKAYPGEEIDRDTLAKGIASFERTILSNNSPFDRWLRGDKNAMTPKQVLGFRLFEDQQKGNCAICHQAPNFTDGGFHNIGLASYGNSNPDLGRFAIKAFPSLKGAFKTPTLRDIALTAPYFHDGSSKNLTEVVEFYNRGGVTKTDLSANIKPLNLSEEEVAAIVDFMNALTSPIKPFTLPILPTN